MSRRYRTGECGGRGFAPSTDAGPGATRTPRQAALAACLAAGALLGDPAYPVTAQSRAPATTAEEVIARNVAARGGLEAWRKIETLVWLGHVERANATGQPMRFVMQLKRPNLTRFEIKGPAGDFTRVFDGTRGWKLRPTAEGVPDLKPFSKEEVAFAQEESVIDGPLIDYQAKGVTAKFDGIDVIEGHKAYRLSLKLRSGAERMVWIDAKTDLDIRYDRPSTSALAPGARVSVYYRNYGTFDGLRIPQSIEIGAAKGRSATEVADRLVIDKVVLNPPLPRDGFAQPQLPGSRHPGGAVTRGTPSTAVPPPDPKP